MLHQSEFLTMRYIQVKGTTFLHRVPNEGDFQFGPNHFQPVGTLTDAERQMLGVVVCEATVMPAFDARKQYLDEADPKLDAGTWSQVWTVLDKTDERIAEERTLGEADRRSERDRRLAACDWTRLDDVQKVDKAAWAKYRQTLRDVPEQADFPYDVVWPETP